ncbi:uncharacterized protein LOC143835316 [Paroedura picta]|uniref:uncharacterized protein LOC143835316 n=1 Tax=Paroedura picta TaxID=143630 RepID=UPI004055ABA3
MANNVPGEDSPKPKVLGRDRPKPKTKGKLSGKKNSKKKKNWGNNIPGENGPVANPIVSGEGVPNPSVLERDHSSPKPVKETNRNNKTTGKISGGKKPKKKEDWKNNEPRGDLPNPMPGKETNRNNKLPEKDVQKTNVSGKDVPNLRPGNETNRNNKLPEKDVPILKTNVAGKGVPKLRLPEKDVQRANVPGRQSPKPNLSGEDVPTPNVPGRESPKPKLQEKDVQKTNVSGKDVPNLWPEMEASRNKNVPGGDRPKPNVPGRENPKPNAPAGDNLKPNVPGRENPKPNLSGEDVPTPKVPEEDVLIFNVPGRENPKPNLSGEDDNRYCQTNLVSFFDQVTGLLDHGNSADVDYLDFSMVKWANENKMQFNKEKCRALHLGHKNEKYTYWMGDTLLGSRVCERDLALVDSRLSMSRQYDVVVKKAKAILDCINRGIPSKSQDVIVPLYTALVKPHRAYCVQFWGSYFKKYVDKMEGVQRRATRMIRGLRTKPYEERLRDLGMLSLENWRLRWDMITVFKYLKSCHLEVDRVWLLLAPEDRTLNNEFKLRVAQYQLDLRKTIRVIKQWYGLPKEAMSYSSREAFK